MLDQYFDDWEIRGGFKEEFISLWPGWLGPEQYHKLDEVTESEWQRFNDLLTLIAERYDVLVADLELRELKNVRGASEIRQSYEAAMNKDASQFLRFVIPELGCVLAEEWDYTYILWHKDGSAVAELAPLVTKAGLHHFGRSAA